MTWEVVGPDRADKNLVEVRRIEGVETWVAWEVVLVTFYDP